MKMPKWMRRNPEKFKKRLIYEQKQIKESSPLWKLMEDDDTGEIYFEGKIITRSNNIYHVRIHPTDNYPYEPPISIIMDNDVREFCMKAGMHESHNYGIHMGGLKICVLKPNDSVGIDWDPTLSMHSLILWTSEWLHAYEVKRKNGRWILPQ